MLVFHKDEQSAEMHTPSLHDALPIFDRARRGLRVERVLSAALAPDPGPPAAARGDRHRGAEGGADLRDGPRSEEHTSELQSRENLVCRLLLEKKKKSRVKQ